MKDLDYKIREILILMTDVTGFQQDQAHSDAFELAVRKIKNLIELEVEQA